MRSITPRAAATIAAALVLASCDDATRLLAPSMPRSSLSDPSSVGSTIAFRSIGAHCGIDMNSGCGDEEGGWGWSTYTSVATIGIDGTGLVHVTYPIEDNTRSRNLNPVWSPDGMRLAFHEGGEILVIAGAGGTPLNLTRHGADDREPTWSPDGGRLAFSSDRGGRSELYVMSAGDGSNVVRLTDGIGFTGHPDWSVDGTRIVFDCEVESGNPDVCAVKADGTSFARLTTAPGYDGTADWSATGRIAFATARYGAASEIAVMNGDGSAVTRVGAGITGEDPDWSPDGGRLAFTMDSYIYIVGSDGTNPMLLASGTSPSWRPTDAALPAVQSPVARLGNYACVELSCTLDGTGSTDDVGTGSLYYMFWSFGDGNGGYYSATPTHGYAKAGTYTVTLTVSASATGKTSSTTQSVTVTGLPVGAPPVASFTTKCVGLTCTLDGTTSTDDVAVVTYSWNLGKETGETATGAVVTTAYATEGSRTAVLTVTDGAGQTSSTTRTFYAAPIPGDAPPVARLNVSCVALQCTLSGRSSSDDHYVVRHYIDTGAPGSTPIWASELTTAYVPGTYTVTLTVFDDAGQMNRVSKTITVSAAPPPNQPPVAAFTYSCVRTKCTFDGRTSTDDQGIISYGWNLGSPLVANTTGAVVTGDYKRPGSYVVTLTVRDVAGQLGIVTRTVAVAK